MCKIQENLVFIFIILHLQNNFNFFENKITALISAYPDMNQLNKEDPIVFSMKGYKRFFPDNKTLELVTYSVICAICISLIHKYSRDEKGNLTCDNYVLNSYLYIVLALSIMSIVFISLENSPIREYIARAPSKFFIFFFIILCTVRYTLLAYLNPNNTITANLLWLIGIVLLGFMPLIIVGFSSSGKGGALFRITDILFLLGFYSIIILIIVGLLINYIPYLRTINWSKIAAWLLFGIFVSMIVGGMYITDMSKFVAYIENLIYVVIVLFALLVAIYHIDVIKNAEKCKPPPDYPSETFNFIYLLRRVIFDIFVLPFKT